MGLSAGQCVELDMLSGLRAWTSLDSQVGETCVLMLKSGVFVGPWSSSTNCFAFSEFQEYPRSRSINVTLVTRESVYVPRFDVIV